MPAPIVFSDVNYLSTTAPPSAQEWSSFLRPLRGKNLIYAQGVYRNLLGVSHCYTAHLCIRTFLRAIHYLPIIKVRVPHFATKYRNIVSQITLRLILFSMVSVFTGYYFFFKPMGSGRARSVKIAKKSNFLNLSCHISFSS